MITSNLKNTDIFQLKNSLSQTFFELSMNRYMKCGMNWSGCLHKNCGFMQHTICPENILGTLNQQIEDTTKELKQYEK